MHEAIGRDKDDPVENERRRGRATFNIPYECCPRDPGTHPVCSPVCISIKPPPFGRTSERMTQSPVASASRTLSLRACREARPRLDRRGEGARGVVNFFIVIRTARKRTSMGENIIIKLFFRPPASFLLLRRSRARCQRPRMLFYDRVLKYHARRDSRDHGKFLGRGRISVKILDSRRI